MAHPAVVTLLRQTVGLNPDTIGAETIARAMSQRMAQCHVSDVQTYLERLQTSAQEVQALIEEVVVPETWFFRDQMPFTYLGRYVMAEWLPTSQHAMLRVLSLACATGEEPYSIAMALLDTGLAPQHVRIDAVDISQRALVRAQRAVYSAHAFREKALAFRDRYFEPHAEGYRVCDRIRNLVTFRQGNLLDERLLADQAPYRVIFCRNTLIYFDDVAKRRALTVLARLLTPGGVLFVGYAETGLFLASDYVPVRYPRAFAYRKPDVPPDRLSPPQRASRQQPPTPPGQRHQPAAPRVLQQSAHPAMPVAGLREPARAAASVLETARQLADKGEVDAATTLCETLLRTHGPNAQAYILLGLLRQAAGHPEQAEHYFHRAVYLQPDHYEALVHLALLLEHRGDTAGAAMVRQRAQRAWLKAR
jgi:chemotaxis protein methyltransferase WspC